MRKALFFDSPAEFSDFVRVHGPTASPDNGSLFELHRVVHPERPGEVGLVVFNFRSLLRDRLLGKLNSIKADVSGNNLELSGPEARWPITASFYVKSLVECVELVPRKKDDIVAHLRGPVYFWVESDHDVATLIRESLQLGNDRIQYGTIENDRGETTSLVRIDGPSFYLIQDCLEREKQSISIFYQEVEDLFIAWGFEHPLRDWWRQSEQKRSGEWVFVGEDNQLIHTPPVIWKDAYDLTDLKLDFQHRTVYTQSAEQPPRFEVRLRLTRKTGGNDDPELWLLDESGLDELEKTLEITEDELLRGWQVTVQRRDGDPRDWVFIRETRKAGGGRRHHDFGGMAFARYRGINDLLLPVGFELQPPLRRDAYRQLFGLESGFITVLVPESDDGSEGDGYDVFKIGAGDFDGLSTFVDYLVERDAVALESLLERSVFDFRHYLKAPSHPGLLPEAKEGVRGNRRGSGVELGSLENSSTGGESESAKADGSSLMDRLETDSFEIDESALGDLEQEELRLEREIISEGQSIERWCDLVVCKNRLGKLADALICAIEAIWLAEGTERAEELEVTLHSISGASLNAPPAAVTAEEPEWVRRAAVVSMVYEEPGPAGEDQWISDCSEFLGEHDAGLRSKERWLAWGRILMRNRDERKEAQLRESIRERITGEGLGLDETPTFLHTRIFLDRKLGGDDNQGRQALESAVENLESLRSIAENLGSERLLRVSQAVLARAFSEIGDIGRAQTLLERGFSSDDLCGQAWDTFFRIEALGSIDVNRAEGLGDRFEELLGRVDAETRRAIGEVRELYREKADADNPAAFLSRENRGRTYPRGPGSEQGMLYTLSQKLEQHVMEGNELEAVSVMRQMMTLEDPAPYADSVKLPQFVETLVAGLERFKWGERGASLLPLFENFADRAPGYVDTSRDRFYGSILHSNLALGLLSFENVEKAILQIDRAEALASGSSELDFIDATAALIKTVEQLPLSHRKEVLGKLLAACRERFDVGTSPYLSNERLFATVAKLLDQMVEAASSKDRISLHQFRNYQLQDEFIVLQRIQSETFVGQPIDHPFSR